MMVTTRALGLRWVVVWFPVAWMMLSSCATGRPPATAPEPPAARAQAMDTTGAGSRSGTPVPAVVDSAPTGEALEVLNRIPEPLADEDRVPPPERGSLPPSSPVSSEPDTSGRSEVPIPSPTQALGQKPPGAPSPGSAATSPGNPPAEPSPPSAAAPAPAPPAGEPGQSPSARDTCWRVQVAASSNRWNADHARAAAESVLMVPMTVVQEGAYFKTRTRDCMDREVADRVKQRAAAAGYPGAFRFPGKP